MDKLSSVEYLPIDVVGIGSTPLTLFILSAALIIVGFIATSLLIFQFKVALFRSLAVLLVAFAGAGITGGIAYSSYQGEASSNLSFNLTAKYPRLSLQAPEEALRGYLTTSSPVEVTVTADDKSYRYGIDLTPDTYEPSLIPILNNDAPNPIEFMQAGGVQ